MTDLKTIGIDVDFKLTLKKYSKSLYGRYHPERREVTLYISPDPKGEFNYPYSQLLDTLIHEAVHCIQWSDPKFKRVKGVMHNYEFKKLENMFMDKAKAMFLMEEICLDKKDKDAHNFIGKKYDTVFT